MPRTEEDCRKFSPVAVNKWQVGEQCVSTQLRSPSTAGQAHAYEYEYAVLYSGRRTVLWKKSERVVRGLYTVLDLQYRIVSLLG